MTTNPEVLLAKLGLTDIESEAFWEKTETHVLPGNTIVLQKGYPSDALYILLEGRAKAVEMASTGREQVQSYYVPGDHFGWTGLGEGIVTTSIMTEEPCRLLVLPKNELKSFLFGSHPLQKRMTEVYVHEAEQKARELSEVQQQTTAIREILRTISSSPSDIQSILDTVAENAARLCNVEDAEIFRVEGNALRLVSKYGTNDLWPVGTLRSLNRDWVAGQAVIDRRSIHVYDLQAAANEFPLGADLAKKFGNRTTFATPLIREGTAIGAILIRCMDVSPLTEKQIELLKTFADEAVIAIENVRLFNEIQEKSRKVEEQAKELAEWNTKLENRVAEQAQELTQWNSELETRVAEQVAQLEQLSRLEYELSLAGEIQRSMLPRSIPPIAGYEFSATMLPAKSVGGDFFDFIPLGDNLLGVAIGDVSDKGVPAALFMAMVRSLLRAEAHPGRSVQKVLRSVNLHLMDMNDRGMFVTVLFGVLNGVTNQFRYVRAGHEVPIAIDGHGSVNRLPQKNGQALGLFEKISLDEQEYAFSQDSILLMCSDGITDAPGPQNLNFGHNGIVETIGRMIKPTAPELCDTLINAAKDHQAGAHQYDDMTVVVIQKHD